MAHVTVAASQKAFTKTLDFLRKNFRLQKSATVKQGRLTATYDLAFHLENGTIELRNDGTVRIKELDIKWDKLKLRLGVDIPEIKVGGFCIIPNPFTGGCAVRAPEIKVFSANPDITLNLDLGSSVHTEVSVTARPELKYFTNPERHPADSDHDAREHGHPHQWRIFIHPSQVDLDLFDVADTAGDLLKQAAEDAVNSALGGQPDWAKKAIKELVGSAIEIFRKALDLPDDLSEWLADLLKHTLGLTNLIIDAVGNYYVNNHPIALEDPFPILPATQEGLIPVLVPLRNLSVRINAQELVVEADVGV